MSPASHRLPAASVAVAAGRVSLSPLPGRGGELARDLSDLAQWGADLVVSLTEAEEAPPCLGAAVAEAGLAHLELPIRDYATPEGPEIDAALPALLARLQQGQWIALHCMGGCGRSGMMALRLMVMAGEPGAQALTRLRAARPCAVETEEQRLWALAGEAVSQAPETVVAEGAAPVALVAAKQAAAREEAASANQIEPPQS